MLLDPGQLIDKATMRAKLGFSKLLFLLQLNNRQKETQSLQNGPDLTNLELKI